MIKRLLVKTVDSVAVAAFLVASSSMISRLLGVFRDRVLAGHFGAGDELDIYYAAFRVPDFVFNLVILGALSAGFIPVFTSLINGENKEANKQEAWRLTNNMLNIIGLFLIILGVVGFFTAPLLIKIITPGFSPEKMAITANLTRIMFLSPFLLGISSVIGGVLQSFKSFFIYSLSPIFYNIGIIIGALYLTNSFGIYGLAWGVVLGSLLHLLVQLPTLFTLGWRYKFLMNFRDTTVKNIFAMMTGRTLSILTSQLNLMVTTIIASTLVAGSLSIYSLANNLQSFPVGVFGISFAIAVFPALSVNAFNKKLLIADFNQTLRRIYFFIIPTTVLFIALRAQIIRAALGSGQFNWDNTLLTMNVMSAFVLSFFAQAAIPLFTRVFYARHDSKTPFYIGLVTLSLDCALAYWLSRSFGIVGIAVSFSLTTVLNLALLWLFLRRELGSLGESEILKASFKLVIASSCLLAMVQATKVVVEPFINMNKFWGVAVQGGLATLFGLIVYLFVCKLLKVEEVDLVLQKIKGKLSFKAIKSDDQGEARGI